MLLNRQWGHTQDAFDPGVVDFGPSGFSQCVLWGQLCDLSIWEIGIRFYVVKSMRWRVVGWLDRGAREGGTD